MPWFPRAFLLVFVGAVTSACGARQSEGPGATIGGTHPEVDAGDREAFDALWRLAQGAPVKQRFQGQASFYADSLTGNRMAGGERYEPSLPVAAHRTIPFGTVVRVVRVSDGRAVVLRVSDRGPFGSKRRIIDVSRAAAERLGMLREGVVEVRVEVLDVSSSRS